jgi:hypothetical protein
MEARADMMAMRREAVRLGLLGAVAGLIAG